MSTETMVLEMRGVSGSYRKGKKEIHALEKLDLCVGSGEIVGIVGESGSGKSTLLKLAVGMLAPTEGQILFEGRDLSEFRGKERLELYRGMQMVFQNALHSFNPRRRVKSSLEENLARLVPELGQKERALRIEELLRQVGLDAELIERFPRELSGGQCQRMAIARALAVGPQLLLCDEITSALDVSVQAKVVELLKKLNRELNQTILFVTHDIALAGSFCSRILVLHQGRCTDQGTVEEVLEKSRNPYTLRLRNAVLDPVEYLYKTKRS